MKNIFNTKTENTNKSIYNKFKKIDSDLKNKHKKVDKQIKKFSSWIEENFYKKFENLTENQKNEIRKYIEKLNLNDLHDAKNNLENLISDNYKDFVDWSCFLSPRKSSKVWINKKSLECFKMEF